MNHFFLTPPSAELKAAARSGGVSSFNADALNSKLAQMGKLAELQEDETQAEVEEDEQEDGDDDVQKLQMQLKKSKIEEMRQLRSATTPQNSANDLRNVHAGAPAFNADALNTKLARMQDEKE